MKLTAEGAQCSIALGLGPVPVLGWLPGETLFSLCSRHHRFWGHRHSWSTASLLFGGRRYGTQHDLPNQLDQFAERTEQMLGSAREIAEEHTLLRFYRPFLADADLDNAILAMRSNSVAHLKFKLGLLTSRFRANHPLKACSACMLVDSAEHGWCYWHLDHQFPGVWACPTHGLPLRESAMKSSGVGRFLWTLPSSDDFLAEGPIPSAAVLARWQSLAALIVTLVRASEPAGWLGVSRMQSVLLAELGARGWVTSTGSLRLKSMSRDFLLYCEELRTIGEFSSLPSSIDEAERQLGRLLRPLRSGTHPLRLLTIAHWLFDSAHAVRRALDRGLGLPRRLEAESNVAQRPGGHGEAERSVVIARIQNGDAPSTVAREFGIATATAKAWAARAGIATARRASVIRPAVLRALKADLASGMDKSRAAQRQKISVSSVNRILRTEVGLHQQWRAARESGAREKARGVWEELLANHGHQGMKFLRAADPAAYAWLYRNDLAWLRAHMPACRPSRSAGGEPRLQWDERDRVLKAAVEATVLELLRSSPGEPLRLWRIYQRIPELKAKLSRLDRMPLTSKALELALTQSRQRGSV